MYQQGVLLLEAPEENISLLFLVIRGHPPPLACGLTSSTFTASMLASSWDILPRLRPSLTLSSAGMCSPLLRTQVIRLGPLQDNPGYSSHCLLSGSSFPIPLRLYVAMTLTLGNDSSCEQCKAQDT